MNPSLRIAPLRSLTSVRLGWAIPIPSSHRCTVEACGAGQASDSTIITSVQSESPPDAKGHLVKPYDRLSHSASPADAVERATYSVLDISGLLCCSVRHVHRLKAQNLIPGLMRVGRLVRFNKAKVDAWIENGCEI